MKNDCLTNFTEPFAQRMRRDSLGFDETRETMERDADEEVFSVLWTQLFL
ncbi:hypothetical protein WH47_10602 [Habropoda laboriosa]|uniref:Uncharacterized protein n=1 Tax=Habropoda laboriosa TaxID=597456 RepID=A0A0L7QLS7_9HYME|nr:hypothetical protein WH47_10602 [Habropoda laboriosa]